MKPMLVGWLCSSPATDCFDTEGTVWSRSRQFRFYTTVGTRQPTHQIPTMATIEMVV